jgi:hypothetical protein
MQKSRIVTIRVWHRSLERGTNPTLSRRVHVSTGNRREIASRNGRVSSSPTRNPYRHDSQLWHRCMRGGAHLTPQWGSGPTAHG